MNNPTLIKFGFDLSRVWQHFENKSFGIVSAYSKLPEEENERRSHIMKKQVRKMGYGYREIYGVWKRDDGTVMIEYPLFIPNLTRDDALHLGRDEYLPEEERHPQEAIVVADNNNILLIGVSGLVVDVWDRMEVGFKESWKRWSEIKNRRPDREWQYSSVEWFMEEPPTGEATGWMSALVRQEYKKDKGVQIWDREKIAEKYFNGD